MDASNNISSEDIIKRILALENKLVEDQIKWKELNETFKKEKEEHENIQVAFREIEKRLISTRDAVNETRSKLSSVETIGKQTANEIDLLRRQYSRLVDAEMVQADYQKRLGELREACESASWRLENRTDGIGASSYQLDGAIHLAVAGRALLGDEMGLGKTLTSIIWMDLLESKKVIVLCPPELMSNFIKEFHLWAPHRQPIRIGKMPKGQRDIVLMAVKQLPSFVVIVNYEAWRKDWLLVEDLIGLEADTLIMDEAHQGKNWATNTSKGIRSIAFAHTCEDKCNVDHAEAAAQSSIKYVLPMTGTPILNRPQELFPNLHIIDPTMFPTENKFLLDFCYQGSDMKWKWKESGPGRLAKLIGPRYLARKTVDLKEAGIKLPEAHPVEHLIDFAEMQENYSEQYKAYILARDYARMMIEGDKAIPIIAAISIILRLRQTLVWPAGIQFKNDETGTLINLNVHESIKLDYAEKIIKDVLDGGERVALFSQFKPGLHVLQERIGSRAVVYDGDTSESLRLQIKDDFDARTSVAKPKWDVVLCNYKTGGQGLNLNAANHVILLDREWNPGKEDQAIARILRRGQTRECHIHTIEVENTIDDYMATLIKEKRKTVEGFESEANMMQAIFDELRKQA